MGLPEAKLEMGGKQWQNTILEIALVQGQLAGMARPAAWLQSTGATHRFFEHASRSLGIAA